MSEHLHATVILVTAPLAQAAQQGSVPSYRPFRDPLPGEAFSFWWVYLVPLSLLIAVAYKAVRMKDLVGYWGAVVVMAVQIIAGMIGLVAASYLLVEVFVPWVRG